MLLMKTEFVIFALISTIARCAFSQGFVNLNFESATIVRNATSPYYPYAVYASNAVPGWTITGNYLGPDEILYNTISLGAASISIFDTNRSFPVLGGRFSIGLYGGDIGVAISQSGIVPTSAISLFFQAQSVIGTMLVSIGGQNLSYFPVATGTNFTLYGATIPIGLAGQSEELMFSALAGNNNYWTIDNIQFSSSPIPEPNGFALAALGTLMVVFWQRRTSMRKCGN
jgi:hypothetical protein